jgi:pimeloyl-ACP methyl ester carboxylesterase
LFVLVHGTWATKAPWLSAGGELTKALLHQWPGAGVFAFRWRGLNRLTARLRAHEELKTLIESLRQRYPDRRLVVIAHSHGGNVAAWATTAVEGVDTVVYLNTPFLRLLRIKPLPATAIRAFGVPPPFDRLDLIALSMQGLFLPLLLLATLPMLFFTGRLSPEESFSALLQPLSGVATVVLSYIYLAGSYAISRRIRWYQRTLMSLTESPRQVRRELVVGATGDEALTGLTTANATISALGAVTRRPLFWFDRVLTQYTGSQLGLVGIAISVLYVLLTIPFGIMLFVAVLAYGPVHGLIAAEATLVTTVSPRGVTDTLSVDVRSEGLRHSLVYSETEVLAAIVDWLRASEAR